MMIGGLNHRPGNGTVGLARRAVTRRAGIQPDGELC